jgi:chromosome segregation ATPase
MTTNLDRAAIEAELTAIPAAQSGALAAGDVPLIVQLRDRQSYLGVMRLTAAVADLQAQIAACNAAQPDLDARWTETEQESQAAYAARRAAEQQLYEAQQTEQHAGGRNSAAMRASQRNEAQRNELQEQLTHLLERGMK